MNIVAHDALATWSIMLYRFMLGGAWRADTRHFVLHTSSAGQSGLAFLRFKPYAVVRPAAPMNDPTI